MKNTVKTLQKIFLMIFVFVIFWMVGWYGEKVVVKFFTNESLKEFSLY